MSSLEDVYWLEDSQANKALGKDADQWSKVRQKLPTSKTHLDTMKADLWSKIVKSSQHQDAWAWGDVLVVSMSFAGLITLAAVTQPSLAPEARNSLLQYVTGKYLMPSNCKVTFDWADPHVVGGTMIFTVRFFQRNGKPYPICDTDQFFVEVSESTRKVKYAFSLHLTRTTCKLLLEINRFDFFSFWKSKTLFPGRCPERIGLRIQSE